MNDVVSIQISSRGISVKEARGAWVNISRLGVNTSTDDQSHAHKVLRMGRYALFRLRVCWLSLDTAPSIREDLIYNL